MQVYSIQATNAYKCQQIENKFVYTTYVARRLVSARREKALPTNGRADTLSYRVACSQLKTVHFERNLFFSFNSSNFSLFAMEKTVRRHAQSDARGIPVCPICLFRYVHGHNFSQEKRIPDLQTNRPIDLWTNRRTDPLVEMLGNI